MTAMAIQFPTAPPETYTRQQINDKLTYWAEHLREHRAGTTSPLTLKEISAQLDRWLDELNALRGR